MSTRGGKRVGPPVPARDEQQDGNEDRVRGEKQGNLGVGETKEPSHPRGDVIANRASQDAPRAAERSSRTLSRFIDHPNSRVVRHRSAFLPHGGGLSKTVRHPALLRRNGD